MPWIHARADVLHHRPSPQDERMQGMQQAEKGDGIQAKEGGMTTDYPQPPRSGIGCNALLELKPRNPCGLKR